MRAALIALGLVGALAATAAAAVPPYVPAIYPTEADFMRQIAVYQQALAANPKDAAASYYLGDAYWEASYLYRIHRISYGADYLDKSIAALEQTVSIDEKNLGAWLLLVQAYHTKGDLAKAEYAAEKVIALAPLLAVSDRAVPPPASRGGVVVVPSAPGAAPAPAIGPTPPGKFNPADFFVIGDSDTKLLYKYSCPSLPAIEHPAFFLTKWEAFDRGYKSAEICTP